MSKWIDLNLAERKVILQSVEDKEKLQQAAQLFLPVLFWKNCSC